MKTRPLTKSRLPTGVRIIARCRTCARRYPADIAPATQEIRIYGLRPRRIYEVAVNLTPSHIELLIKNCRRFGLDECADCGSPDPHEAAP